MTNTETTTETNTMSNTDESIDINHFKLCLKEYLKLDDEIKTLQTVLRNKKNKYDNIEETLLLFLQKNKINQVQLEGEYQGKELITKTLNRTKNVSSNGLIDIIKDKCSNDQKLYQSILDEIEKNKETTEVNKLSIAKPKSNKSKASKKQAQEETDKLLMDIMRKNEH